MFLSTAAMRSKRQLRGRRGDGRVDGSRSALRAPWPGARPWPGSRRVVRPHPPEAPRPPPVHRLSGACPTGRASAARTRAPCVLRPMRSVFLRAPASLRRSAARRRTSTMATAARAASAPLFPGPGAERARACASSRTVSTPKPTGTPVSRAPPPRGRSPPRARCARSGRSRRGSPRPGRRSRRSGPSAPPTAAARGSSKAPGTSTTVHVSRARPHLARGPSWLRRSEAVHHARR